MPLTLTRGNVRALPGSNTQRYQLNGATAKVGDQVYIDSSDKVVLARANAAATAIAKGIIIYAAEEYLDNDSVIPDGAWVGVCLGGPIAGFEDMTPGGAVYTSSATAGVSTQTAPTGAATWTNKVGFAAQADILWVVPDAGAPTSNS